MPPNIIAPDGMFMTTKGMPYNWVYGNAQTDRSPSNIMTGVLFSYTRTASIYHCPTDRSKVTGVPGQLRFRSYGLSAPLGGGALGGLQMHPANKLKTSQLREPSKTYTFLDLSQWTIADGVNWIPILGAPEGDKAWGDYPSDRHSQGANVALGDGRVEYWRWPKPLRQWWGPAINSQDLEDLRRLQNALPGTWKDR